MSATTRPEQTAPAVTPPSKHGLSSRERPDPIGLAVAVLNKLAQTSALDRLGLRKPAERGVITGRSRWR